MLIVKCSADRVAPEKAVHLEPPFCTIISRDTTRGIEMKYIPLTQGKFAIVDDKNYKWLLRYSWRVLKIKHTCYALTSVWDFQLKIHHTIRMHRLILNAQKGEITDHINHNGLDNRECNIRKCTHSQNNQNRKPYNLKSTSKYMSKYKGVYHISNKWMAGITLNKNHSYLGLHNTEIEAAKAYDKKAREIFGEFAFCNFKL